MKERSYNENELVYMIQQGDEESFRLLLELYQPKIRAIIRQTCTYQLQVRNPKKDLQQIASQALFRAVFEYQERFHIRFSTYCARVIRNALIDYQRSQYRRDLAMRYDMVHLDAPLQGEEGATMLEQMPSLRVEENGAFQIYVMAAKQREEWLKRQLKPLEYEIYCLRCQGDAYAQIAKRCSVSVKKVENTLAKIRRLMKE